MLDLAEKTVVAHFPAILKFSAKTGFVKTSGKRIFVMKISTNRKHIHSAVAVRSANLVTFG